MVPKKNTAKDLWQPRRRIEVTYKRSLRQIVKKMNKIIRELRTADEITRALKNLLKVLNLKSMLKAVQRR